MYSVDVAVLPVAGLGSRFLPATKSVPKEMLPVVDKPLVAYAVEEALQAGVREFVFVTSRHKKALEDYFDDHPEMQAELEAAGKAALLQELRQTRCAGASYYFVRQTEPRGTGDAVWRAQALVGSRAFAVLFPDELLVAPVGDPSALQQLVQAHARDGRGALGVLPVNNPQDYGVVELAGPLQGHQAQVRHIVEKPKEKAPSNLAVVGRYVFAAGFMGHLERIQNTMHGREVYLTDAIEAACAQGQMNAVELRAQRFDCGSKLGYAQANVALALARPELDGPLRAYLTQLLKV